MAFNLSALDGSNGFRLDGIKSGDHAGGAVATAGDFNGDGYDDIIIGADGSKVATQPNMSHKGEAYVVFGGPGKAAASTDLSSLNGSNGFKLIGVNGGDYTGYSVSYAGDINKDGKDDIIIGAPLADADGNKDAGEAFVVFGTGNTGRTIDLNNLNGKNGFRIDGEKAGDNAGWAVNEAGDVNGDGIDDIIIGAHFADGNGQKDSGEAYIVYGKKGGFGSSFDLSSIDGQNGVRLDGAKAGDLAGKLVDTIGDINRDGYDDVIIGARGADPSGRVDAGSTYVLFGGKSLGSSIDLGSLDGSDGFRLDGAGAGDRSGRHASGVGDINGDGYEDFAIGSWKADPLGRKDAGESYVIYGKKGGFPKTLNLSQVDGKNGFKIIGAKAGDESGRPVSNAGDVNGDGIDDMLVGGGLADPNGKSSAGSTYLIYGKKGGFGKSLDLAKLSSTQGFVIDGIRAGDEAGRPAEAAGDVNGDGYDDIIIGATFATADGKNNAGQAYVVFGGPNGPASSQPSGGTSNQGSTAPSPTPTKKTAAVDTTQQKPANDTTSGKTTPDKVAVVDQKADTTTKKPVDTTPKDTVAKTDNAAETPVKDTASRKATNTDTKADVPVAPATNQTVVKVTADIYADDDDLVKGGTKSKKAAKVTFNDDKDDAKAKDTGTKAKTKDDSANDTGSGNTGTGNSIMGTDGADRLRGSSKDEYIDGGAGRDNINGGGGDDYISSGTGGSSFIRGGSGSDTFEFAVGFSTVKVFDFKSGTDKIDLTGGLDFSDFRVTESSYKGRTKTNLWTDDGDRLILNGVSADSIDGSDFI